MIDPTRKPVEAQQAKPVVKPANTHSIPKRAQLVLITFSCFNTFTGIALYYFDS